MSLLNFSPSPYKYTDKLRKFDEDTTIALKYDLNYTQQIISDEKTCMNRLNILLNMINQCEQCVNEVRNVFDLFFLHRIVDELKQNYENEYKKYRLGDLAIPILHPQLKQYLSSNWNIYNDNHKLIEFFSKWKQILEDDTIDLIIDNSIQSKENMDSYHRLVWDVYMPFLRKSILEWNPRQPDHLIDFIKQWMPYLPQWIIDKYIHGFIHAQALHNWQPSDLSAKAVLLPWQKVFKQETWNAFMNKYIVSKLISTMQQFIIDPREQILDPWHWFIAWYDMVPLSSMITILEKFFFPKWLQVLDVWLNTNPNYQEIQRWYSGWRSLLPQAIINHTIIKEKLTEGLMMIDQRISETFNTIYNRGVAISSSNVVSSFKDLIEKKAAEHNLLFLPVSNRTFEGHQIYQLGNTNIYMDKSVIFVHETSQWVPTHLYDVINRQFDLCFYSLRSTKITTSSSSSSTFSNSNAILTEPFQSSIFADDFSSTTGVDSSSYTKR
ncbi:unnamed protein product [Rotaria sordida]|uniref:GCF C-terminal domain-containing protein n=1 Tax=Rotaria sordida TaxID=392033 RepID=A0A815GFJ3_9BILA|nr:unnamed protein product [Rotaria sordida]CAF3791851.1 unnamed protein product [Rotaria sordida]